MKVIHVVGARPNFMKIGPLLRELRSRDGYENLLVHTGQHYDREMSEAFFEDLGIPEPDLNLGVGSGSHGAQTAAVMERFEPVVEAERPDLVVVVGDVNSTLAATLVAVKLHVPVAHVEAGLRSGDRAMPEEINRILTDQIAEILLTPSPDADDNLRREGIPDERIHFVGNIMIDSLLENVERARGKHSVEEFGVEARRYVLVTLHRPSNVDDPGQLREIVGALDEIGRDRTVLLPVHPRTRRRLEEFSLEMENVVVTEPLGYLEFLTLQAEAAVVITDSGGIQEETTVLGIPCLTLRSTTERPITISEGTNRLVPVRTRERILEAFEEAVGYSTEGRRPELWDGRTAGRIADVFDRRRGA